MKKVLSLALAGIMVLGIFAGCSKSGTSEATSGGTTTKATTAAKDSFSSIKEISVVSREDGSGTRGAFTELFGILEKSADGKKTDKTTKEAIIANKTDVMVTNIAGDKYSIGYVSLGSLSSNVKAVDIDNVKATAENVKNGTYKASRPFNIATKGEPQGLAKDFIDFILSKEGQEVVGKSYISVSSDAKPYSGSKPSGKLTIGGSSSVSPIMEKLKEAYLKINTNAAIEIQTSDSTAGMTGTIDGTCQIGMASRELKDSEKEKLTSCEIALDGIAVIVNPENPTENLTSAQVKDIFTGTSTKWDMLSK